jgi:hypothetical protein
MNQRVEHGHFAKGNKLATGRPRGSRGSPPSFLEYDQRSAPARRFRALVARMAIDLGGENFLSAGEQQLIRRCAMISVQCETMEQAALGGATLDATTYSTLTGQLARALRTLGLKRPPREPEPMTLEQYLEARHLERQANGTFKAADNDETATPETTSS